MIDIKEMEWKEIEVQTIFDVTRGNAKDVTKRKFGGNIALVSATDKNNAFYDFVTPNSSETVYKDTMTIHNNGNGVGLAFYHNYKFIATSDVTILIDKTNKISKEVAEFLIAVLQKQKEKYCYGYKLSNERLKKQKILLPIKENGTINFEFMEKYIEDIREEKIKAYSNYINKELETVDTLHTHTHTGNLLIDKKWKEFYLKDVFSKIMRGKRLKSNDHIKGSTPYISSTGINNGIDDFVSNENARYFENCLTIANSGSVGSTFYHQYRFAGSDHITSLQDNDINKYIYLFMIPTIARLNEKYSFNREINDARIKKEKILLPINAKEEIDYKYMEEYSKFVISNLMKKYLQYINKKYSIKC